MTGRWHCLLATTLVLGHAAAGCSRLPRVRPAQTDLQDRSLRARCKARFPQGRWRVVHAIRARLPFGNRTAFIGVVQGDADSRRLRIMAVALEGVTLLDMVVEAGQVTVRKAVPPLDREGIAQGFARDVMLLMLEPSPRPRVVGTLPDGRAVCRYVSAWNTTVDVLPGRAQSWWIHGYDKRRRLRRTVHSQGASLRRFASRLSLRAPGMAGYALDLRRLRVEPAPPSRPPVTPDGARTAPRRRPRAREGTSPPTAP